MSCNGLIKLSMRQWMNAVLLVLLVGSVILLHQNMKTLSQFDRRKHITNSRGLNWTGLFQKPPGLDCTGYIEGDKAKILQGLALQSSYKRPGIPDERFTEITTDCEVFKRQRGYITQVTATEQSFPIAYSILLYKEAEQAEKLLLAIYRPQNWYCIHVDKKSPEPLHVAMKAIAKCFPNVFIVSKTETIVYAGLTRLKADINCMEDLVASNKSWKYFINLPSQEFPLKTNSEIIKILKIYNGSNDIEGITAPQRMLAHRYRKKHILLKDPQSGTLHFGSTEQKNPPPPHNITIVKGSAYGVFSRAFVEFVLTDSRVKDFLKWCENVLSPDEYFWATLHHQGKYGNFSVPGGYNGDPDTKPWLAAHATWAGERPCHGRWVRTVCVYGLQDLARLTGRKELFANKFYLDVHPFALICMEEWLRNKTLSVIPMDLYYYRQLPFLNG